MNLRSLLTPLYVFITKIFFKIFFSKIYFFTKQWRKDFSNFYFFLSSQKNIWYKILHLTSRFLPKYYFYELNLVLPQVETLEFSGPFGEGDRPFRADKKYHFRRYFILADIPSSLARNTSCRISFDSKRKVLSPWSENQ